MTENTKRTKTKQKRKPEGDEVATPPKAKKAKATPKMKAKKPVPAPKKWRGPPSTYTAEVGNKICTWISEGKSLASICKLDGIPSQPTVFTWLRRHTDFYEQYLRARELQADSLFDECLDISDDSSKDFIQVQGKNGEMVTRVDHEHVNRSRLRVDTRKWMAAKLSPKKYGEKLTQEVTGRDGGPIEMNDADLVKLVAAIFAERTVKEKQADGRRP